jgi:hypothetical protein
MTRTALYLRQLPIENSDTVRQLDHSVTFLKRNLAYCCFLMRKASKGQSSFPYFGVWLLR